MEEAFFDTPLYREFAQLEEFARMPDESTILRFRHRLEEHKLAEQILITVNDLLSAKGLLLKVGTVVDASLIAAPTSTKNKDRARDPDMHSSKKGNQWYFGMKAHIGADAESGLVHTVRGTSGHGSDIAQGNTLLHGDESVAFGDVRVTRESTNVRTQRLTSLGMLPCARANEKHSTKTTRLTP